MLVSQLRWSDDGEVAGGPTALDSPGTLVLVFAKRDAGEDPARFAAVRRAFPTSIVAGCSTSGHFWGPRLHDAAMVGVAARFDHTELAMAITHVGGPAESFAAGRDLVGQLPSDGLAGILLLSDGVRVNGSDLVRGVTSLVADGVPVSGGLASDDAAFASTWVLAGDRQGPGNVVAIGFYGDRIRLDHGSHGGWAPFGPRRRVTHSEGHVVFELDGRPALALYRDYLGDYAADLPGSALLFPLSVQLPGAAGPVVRTILAVDDDAQSMTFAGDVPEGSSAQLMRASAEMLVDGALAAAEQCLGGRPAGTTGATLALGISCVGRRLVLGERVEDELDAVLDVFGDGTELVGFYSNGEISTTSGQCDLHNQTMTLTLIGEA
jgi:hypothetical protein